MCFTLVIDHETDSEDPPLTRAILQRNRPHNTVSEVLAIKDETDKHRNGIVRHTVGSCTFNEVCLLPQGFKHTE